MSGFCSGRENLKAVILAAGEGHRCRPLTQTRPKVMLPLANMPFMEHVVRALVDNGIEEIVAVVGYQKERVMDYFEDGVKFGARITYVFQEERLGTAHALRRAQKQIDDQFLVLNGDNILDSRAVRDLLSADGDYVILGALREHAGDYGVLVVDGDVVKQIHEKPGRACAGIVNTGAYKMMPDIFDEIPKTPISERGGYEITQTLSQMLERGVKIRAVVTKGIWGDAVFAWDLLAANSIAAGLMKAGIRGEIEDGAVIRGPVALGKGSLIRSGSYIIGPVLIGEGCDIGPNVTILPSTTIGDSVRVGSFTEIRNSIVMRGSRIGSMSVISDSVIGEDCCLGDMCLVESGSSLAEVEGEFYRAEFGAVMGDSVVAGSRIMMLPCSVVGSSARLGSGVTIRGSVERGSRVV
ncbi:MAG: sugar phosphate nucleotidyltransferase [Methanothrix sp.]